MAPCSPPSLDAAATAEDPSGRLLALRSAIDAVDGELLSLLTSRARHAAEIGTLKQALALPVRDPAREAQVRQRLREANDGVLADTELLAIMDRVIEACRRVQRPERVACLGPEGSFSHEATCERFGEADAVLLTETITEAIDRVADGRATCAVVPADNAQVGPIAETRAALAQRPSLRVREAIVREIELVLLVPPGTTAIREIRSKPEALAQCQQRLRAAFPHARLVDAASTSAAARFVATQDPAQGIAALASPGAAARYGLEVCARDLVDREANTTVFWVIEPGEPRQVELTRGR